MINPRPLTSWDVAYSKSDAQLSSASPYCTGNGRGSCGVRRRFRTNLKFAQDFQGGVHYRIVQYCDMGFLPALGPGTIRVRAPAAQGYRVLRVYVSVFAEPYCTLLVLDTVAPTFVVLVAGERELSIIEARMGQSYGSSPQGVRCGSIHKSLLICVPFFLQCGHWVPTK